MAFRRYIFKSISWLLDYTLFNYYILLINGYPINSFVSRVWPQTYYHYDNSGFLRHA